MNGRRPFDCPLIIGNGLHVEEQRMAGADLSIALLMTAWPCSSSIMTRRSISYSVLSLFGVAKSAAERSTLR